jgi:polyphosphate kinase 2 (PPK2 family)
MGDLEERRYWDDYQEAFDDALSRTSTDHAPWYVVPANRKWFRNLPVASILADTMAELKPRYPAVSPDVPDDLVIE